MNNTTPESEQPVSEQPSQGATPQNEASSMVSPKGQVTIQSDMANPAPAGTVPTVATAAPTVEPMATEAPSLTGPTSETTPLEPTASEPVVNEEMVDQPAAKSSSKAGLIVGLLVLLGVLAAVYFFLL